MQVTFLHILFSKISLLLFSNGIGIFIYIIHFLCLHDNESESNCSMNIQMFICLKQTFTSPSNMLTCLKKHTKKCLTIIKQKQWVVNNKNKGRNHRQHNYTSAEWQNIHPNISVLSTVTKVKKRWTAHSHLHLQKGEYFQACVWTKGTQFVISRSS